jgi:hypothetical protein
MNLAKYDNASFEWGRLDCCLFVADVLLERTGRDYAAEFRGQYDSEFGARRILVKHGGLEGVLRSIFGPMRPPGEAAEGDPVLLSGKIVERDSIGMALGIYDGKEVAYLTRRGLARAPLSYALGVFRV